MPDVREISAVAYFDRAANLARQHWLETEAGLVDQPPCLPVATYEALEANGNLITFGAFDGDELVGYSVAMIVPHMHYDMLCAHHDLLFVRADFRKGSLGLRLMRETETAAKARGAKFVVWHAKPGSTFETILHRIGYAVEETVYRKDL